MKRGWLAWAPAILLLAGTASAQMPEIPPGKWWKRPRVVEFLKITPDQQERLEEVFQKQRRVFVDLKADVERRQIDLEDLMSKKDSDPKKVSASVEALEASKMRLRKTTLMMVVDMKQILTASQWEAILARRDEWRRERMDERRRRRSGDEGEDMAPMRPRRQRPGETRPAPEPD